MSKGTKMAKLNRNATVIKDYILLHLASVGKEAGDLGEDLIEEKICPGDKPYDTEKRRAILRERLIGTLAYIAVGCRDLLIAGRIARRGQGRKGMAVKSDTGCSGGGNCVGG